MKPEDSEPRSATDSSLPTASDSATPTSPDTPLEIWRAFDLNGRRSELDKQGLAIADRQEASVAARKQLSTTTRTFKKSMTDGTTVSPKDVGSLLRAYQTEVDALTNRAKAAESAFLSLYKALYDAPDPVDELSQASRNEETITELRQELKSLREERGGLVERTAAAAKYEKRIEELEAQLAGVEGRVEEEARVKLEEKQAQWMAAQQKAIEAYEMREQELLHQIRLGNENARRLRSVSDDLQRQVSEAKAEVESVRVTRANVNELAVEDLERTRAEAKNLRRRCEELESQLEGGVVGGSALSAELAAREVEISQLRDQVSALEEVLGGKDKEKKDEFATLSAKIVEKDAELAELRTILDKLPTLEEYETLSRQFETLQAFQLLENEQEGEEGEEEGDMVSPKMGETLEKRLLGKVKSLEGKLTRMRVDLGERDSRINELLAMVRSFEERVADQKELIGKLEEGINAMTGEKSNVHMMKRRAVVASRETENGGGADESKEGLNDSTWDWGDKAQAEGLQNIIKEEPSMLDIVSGQRDRFRARTMELEEDNRKLMERIEKLTSDLDALKNDNVRLYEKIRFVQSYKQSNGAMASGGGAESEGGDEEEGVSLLGKYRSMYEDMVNPYTIFNRRERHKRISEMSAPERLTLRASQRALSTKMSRLFVFFYIIMLHVLVALVLGYASSLVCEHDVTTKAQH